MSDCIEWQMARTDRGYGRKKVSGKTQRAHRLAWEEAHGPIPAGMVVMHACDNPPCVNPDHLRLGTVADNNQDCVSKGRNNPNKGVPNPKKGRGMAVLTETDIRTIRERRVNGDLLKDIAVSYGVALSTIGEINRGRTWTHVQ